MKLIIRLLLLVLALAWSSTAPVRAAAPYGLVGLDGLPFRWDTTQPISYSVDLGPLGQMTNAEAVAAVQTAFQRWDEVETAAISFVPGAPLTEDITGANFQAFLDNIAPGVNPIIFDNDGSIIRALLGSETAAVALGRPTSTDPATGRITGGYVIINGLYIDGRFNPDDLSLVDLRGMIVQEIGRFLGLGYTQLNTELILDGIAENNSQIPQMYVQPVPGNGDQLTTDDRASLTALYPNPAVAVSFGTIRGQVLLPDNLTGLQGINVIARRIGDPGVSAVSAISGVRFKNEVGPEGANGSRQPGLRGAFEITGLPPGAYLLYVEALRPESMAGPLRQPAFLPGGLQFYRPGAPATSDPNAAVPVNVGPGQAVENANFLLNVPAGPALQNVAEREPNQFPEQAQALPLAARVQGSVQPNDPSGVSVPVPGGGTAPVQDLYRLTLTGPTLLTVTLASGNVGTDLSLYLLSGPVATAPVVRARSTDPGTPPESFQLRMPAGVYYVAVGLVGGPASAYTLEVNGTAAPDVAGATPQRPRLNNLIVANITTTTASTGFISDLPSNTLLYLSNWLTEYSNPTQTREHRQALSNLASGTSFRLQTMAVTPEMGIGRLPDVFFTSALPALPGGVGQVFAGITDIIEDPDDPNAFFVVLGLRNVGTGDASNVIITQLAPPQGWAFTNPLPSPLGLGFLGRGGSGVVMARLHRTDPNIDTAPILSGTGTYFSPGVGQQQFNFGGAVAFLSVQKSVTPASARPGDIVTFTLTAINGGQGPANGVILTDTLPAGLQFLDASTGGQFQNGAVFWNLGTLAPGGSITTSFRARVAAGVASGTTITNVALIRSNESPTPIASNVVPLEVTAPPAQLRLTKQANRTTAGPGEVITYSLDYANVGGSAATSAVLTDSLPAGTTFVDATGLFSISGGVVSWAIGNLAPNESGQRQLRVQVSPGTPGGIVIQNIGQLAAAEAPAAVSSNVASVSVTAPPQLQITKSANTTSARPGDIITFSLAVANTGGGAATNVQLFDQVPANTTYVDSLNGSLQSGQVVWNLGTIGPGGQATVSFRVQVQQGAANEGVINNIALATSAEIPNGVASNNVAVGIVAFPQLQLSKSASPTTVRPGDIISYSLTVGNAGAGTATNVQVFDPVPQGTQFVDAVNGSLQGNQVVWNVGTVGPGGQATVSFRVQVQANAGSGTINNVGQARSTEVPGGVSSNNAPVTVLSPPQLQLTKQADRQTAGPNDLITYSLFFSNQGPGAATGVQLTDAIPAGTQFVDALGASFTGNSVVWNLGTLPAGASGTRTLRVRVQPGTGSGILITNTAQLTSQERGPLDSNVATVTVSVPTAPALQIQKTVDRTTAAPGELINYQIRVINTGNSAATSLSIQDQVPANTAFVSATAGAQPFGGTVFWTVPSLQPNQQVLVNLQVRVNQGVPNGTQIANSARVTATEAPGGIVSNVVSTQIIVVTPPARLDIQKAADVASVQPGGLINYTITVTNGGGNSATNVIVTDTIPAGTQGVLAQDGGFISFGVASWNLGTLTPGATRQLHLRVQVNNNATGTVTNTAQARSNETSPVSSNPVNTPISAPPSVTLNKVVDKATAAPGTDLRYDIGFRNNSPFTLSGARIVDQIPAGTQFLLASGNITPVGNTLTWNLPSLAPGQEGSVTFHVRILPGTPGGTQISNQAALTVPSVGFNQNSNVVTTTVSVPTNLVIQKTVDKTTAAPDEVLEYDITFQNQGGGTVNGAVIRDQIPANVQLLSASQGATLQGNVIQWSLPAIVPGGQGAVSFRVRILPQTPNGTQITNVASINVAAQGFTQNSNPVTTTVQTAAVSLILEKQVDKASAPPGDLLTYRLTYTNNGPQTLTGLQIVDPLPANTAFFDATDNGQVVAGSVRWNLPNVGPNSQGFVQFRARINQGVPQGTVIQNQGRLGGPQVPQPVLSAIVSTTVTPQQILLTLTKQVDRQTAPAGETLTYTLTFANNGQQTFNQVVISDPIPQGTSFENANNNGQLMGNEVRWQLQPLGPGASGSVAFTVRISPNVPQGTVIQNQGRITSPQIPQQVASNVASTTVTAAQIALTLTKQVDKTSAPAGDILTYTLSYANNGPQTFNQVEIIDPVPGNTTFESAENGGQLFQGSVRWVIPVLGPGGQGSVSFRVRINDGTPQGTVIQNQGRIGGPAIPQPILSQTVNTTVAASQGVQLTLNKTVDRATAQVGDVLTYTLTYRNNGPQTFNQLFINDPLPPNTTFVDATEGGEVLTGAVRWTTGPVGPGGNGVLQFRVRINPGTPEGTVIPNQARLGGGSANPFPIVLSEEVTTTVGSGQPPTSFAGTWFAIPPTGHAVSLTVDTRNRFTVWAVSADRTTVQRSAQGALNPDGSFDGFSADQQVRFTGQVAANGQSARIEANRQGFVSFGVTAPRAPDVNPLPDQLVGTWNGFGVAANGDRLQVRISIDPGGNSTFHGDVVRAGTATPRNQFARFFVTPDGRLTDPGSNQSVGALQLQGNQLVLTYSFQHQVPTPYQNTFQVPLQPLP